MRIFLAGATGIIGRALIPALVSDGHEVYGLARTPDKMLTVAHQGGKPFRGDILDPESMRTAIHQVRPDIIINFATRIPLKLRVTQEHWKENDKIRTKGTGNLLAGIPPDLSLQLFIQASTDQVYAPAGDRWIDERSPLGTHPFLQATRKMEEMVLASRYPATLLRFSVLNDAGSWHTQQSITALRRGMLPIIGDGGAYISMIHLQDAVQAILCAVRQPQTAARHIFNVSDNNPVRMQDLFPYVARLMKAPTPRQVPQLMAKMVVGSLTIDVLTQSRRMSNAKIREQLAFTPQFPTYQEIWQQVLDAVGNREFKASDELS